MVGGIFNISHSVSLGKYLGCPGFQNKPNTTTFQDIINKAMTKLIGWNANYLSKVGWIVLIQSHLESLLAHTMQCFQLPRSTTT